MPAPAQQRQSYQLPPGKYQQAIEFNRRLDTLHFLSVAWTLAVLAMMLRFRAARRIAGRGVVAVAGMLAMVWIADLPVAAYRHWLAVHYGLSIEPWGAWWWDSIKAALLSGAVAVAMIMAFLVLARRAPRRWWIYAWAVAVGFMIGATYLLPVVVEPMFYEFTPLAEVHPELIAPLAQVAARAGEPVPPERIFEMKASEKTRTLNAYLTGFGSTKRIVIWDTASTILTPPQVQTVFAHEVGHYALYHIPRSIAVAAVALLAGLFALDRTLRWVLARWGARWQINGLSDHAVLPLTLLLVTLGGFLAEPAVNSYSRWQEHEADVFELRIMRELIPHAGANSARVDQIMAEISLDDPSPGAFVKFWRYDHPATDERMRFAGEFAP